MVNVLALENSDEISNYFQSTCTDSDYNSLCWSNVYFRWRMTRTVRKELRKGKVSKPENWREKKASCTGPPAFLDTNITLKKKNVQGPGILLFAQFQRGLSVSMAGYRKLSPVCASQTHKQKNYLVTKSIGPILPEFNWGSLVFTFLINTPGDDHILTSEAHLSETLQQKWKEGGYFDQCTLLIDFWTKLIKLYQINKHI